MKKTLLLASATYLFSLQAYASDFSNTRFYVGADYNYTNMGLNDVWDGIAANNYSSGSFNTGIKFNQYFGLEGFYQKSIEESSPYGSFLKTSFSAYGADLLLYTPLNKKTNFLVSAGIAEYTVEADIKYAGLTLNDSESGIGSRIGLGFEYNINENWTIRAMGRYVMLNLDSVDNMKEFSVGVRYSF